MKILPTLVIYFAVSLSLFAQSGYMPVFTLANPVVIGEELQFDVLLHNAEAHYFHTRGQIYLRYDTSVFATNLAQAVRVERLSLLNEQTNLGDKYSIVNIADNREDILAITWAANSLYQDTSSASLTEVPVVPTPLLRLSLPTQQGAELTALHLVERLMADQQMYVQDEMVSTAVAPESPEVHSLKIWPNPARDLLHIASSHPGVATFAIRNSLGQEQHRSTAAALAGGRSVTTISWPAGLYWVHALDEEGRVLLSRKLLVVP